MAIPLNIKKEHILSAIEEISKTVIPSTRLSVRYLLKIGEFTFPPKYVISIASKYANNKELDSEEFNALEAVHFLNKLGFEIISKSNGMEFSGFYDQLKKFLNQAQTTDKTYSHYLKEYSNLQVRVSFGKGNPAEIPWIAFLREGESVQNGIYPVYLLYKQQNLLILAYGISETIKPQNFWNIENGETIEKYFQKNRLGKPKRYGNSYVFKSYNTDLPLDELEINSDLNYLLKIYKKIDGDYKPTVLDNFQYLKFDESISKAGLYLNKKISLRFISSLLTKPLVILTGLSGSGKTKLAQAFVTWICENENQYCMVPVGADWTNREPLLGFPNALKPEKYIKPDNGVLDLIIEANKNAEKPYFLILDEMNLSHVERYFADFLSVMESDENILLHEGAEPWDDVPAKIGIPKNLFIVGTVNVDETTYMFSPKVLDRANVIEFRVTKEEMKNFLSNGNHLDLESIKSNGSNMALDFVKTAKDKVSAENNEELQNTLLDFFIELKKTGAEFGYRSAAEIMRFSAVVKKLDSSWDKSEIIDAAIMQKLLPKVHGSRRKLEPVLKTLGNLCLNNGHKIDELVSLKAEVEYDNKEIIKYPVSLEKIIRMYHGLLDNGFTSYAEA